MPTIPSEADIIFNRASVALAKSQRLIASWLPPPSELTNAKSDAEMEREEQEMFTPVPELLGLGATLPKEGEAKRHKLDTEEKLRRQLLGKDYKKLQANRAGNSGKVGVQVGHGGMRARPVSAKQTMDDSEDEEGRSSLGKPKRRKVDKGLQRGNFEAAIIDVDSSAPATSQGLPKQGSYLDEVLARKSQAKSVKSKKRRRDKSDRSS